MASIINTSTTLGGIATEGDSSNELKIQTDGTDAISIDGSQVVTFANSPVGVASLSTASGSAPSYSARAWVNFDGTGTVAIRASGNVSSITDNGTGDYTVNFTTAMPDADYCVTSSNKYDNADSSFANSVTVVARYTNAFQTGSIRVQTGITSLFDTVAVCVAIFR